LFYFYTAIPIMFIISIFILHNDCSDFTTQFELYLLQLRYQARY